MQLPAITLPQIDLPFVIPAMSHPFAVHFAIALPVLILLLEVYNLFIKRKSIGVFSFILLLLTVILFVLAYQTGVVDAKETFDLLSDEGKALLKEHKLLGTYLLLGSVLILFLKLFSLTGKAFFKLIYIMSLVVLIFFTFHQGKEGGELTYTHGANVAKVQALDDALFDANDALEELREAVESVTPEEIATPQIETVEEAIPIEETPIEEVPAQVLQTFEATEQNINADNVLNSDKVLSSPETTEEETR